MAANTGISVEDIAAVDDARDIYLSNCASCHGFDGSPILAGVPNFTKWERLEKDDSELFISVRDGRPSESGGVPMPAWKGILSEEEVKSVITYLRVIQGDAVFQDNCLSCHDSGVPPIAETIPKSVNLLKLHEGPFNLCQGTDTDNSMEREDIISVIGFLVGVTKN